jgi:hypothetical protein
MARPYVRDWDPLANEVAKHASAIRREAKSFVGRTDELATVADFLKDSEMSLCVVYGRTPSINLS